MVSILDSYFKIFEGADDQKFRKQGLEVSSKLQKALQNIKPTDLDKPKPGTNVVSVNVGELLKNDELKDLNLWFQARSDSSGQTVRGGFLSSPSKGTSRIVLFVDVPEDVVSKLTDDVWAKIISKQGATVLSRSEEIFWHEFIHYMDYKRMSPDSRKKAFQRAGALGGKNKNVSKYYNNPVETNAFIQQGLSRIENHLSAAKDKGAVQKLIGTSANDFYKRVTKVLSPGVFKNMDDKNKAKLKKRVAQMWNDVMKRFQ